MSSLWNHVLSHNRKAEIFLELRVHSTGYSLKEARRKKSHNERFFSANFSAWRLEKADKNHGFRGSYPPLSPLSSQNWRIKSAFSVVLSAGGCCRPPGSAGIRTLLFRKEQLCHVHAGVALRQIVFEGGDGGIGVGNDSFCREAFFGHESFHGGGISVVG